MERRISGIIVFLMLIAVAGCGATGSRFVRLDSKPDKAMVYIYRKSGFAGSAVKVNLFANGKYITQITNGGYYVYETNPGLIEFKETREVIPIFIVMYTIEKALEKQRPIISFEALPGQEYFFEFKLPNKINRVSREEALENLKNMQLFEDKQAANQGATVQ